MRKGNDNGNQTDIRAKCAARAVTIPGIFETQNRGSHRLTCGFYIDMVELTEGQTTPRRRHVMTDHNAPDEEPQDTSWRLQRARSTIVAAVEQSLNDHAEEVRQQLRSLGLYHETREERADRLAALYRQRVEANYSIGDKGPTHDLICFAAIGGAVTYAAAMWEPALTDDEIIASADSCMSYADLNYHAETGPLGIGRRS